MVSLPVLDPLLKIDDSLPVLFTTLGFVYTVGDALGNVQPLYELVFVRIV